MICSKISKQGSVSSSQWERVSGQGQEPVGLTKTYLLMMALLLYITNKCWGLRVSADISPSGAPQQ